MKDGWTYKKLGELGTFIRGGGFLKKDYVENGIPCIHYGQIHTILGPITQKHITSIPETLRNKTRFASKGDIIFAITSEDIEGSCKCTAWLGDYDVAVGGHAAIYKHNLYPAYVSYYAKSSSFYKQKEKYVHGFKVIEIKPSDIAQIDIPVPPLSEQQRIVSRLDAAFVHIDELKANAEKQLSEARALFQKALTKAVEPKEGWEEKTLKELTSEIGDGLHGTPKYSDNGVYYFVNGNNLENGIIEIKDNTKRVDFEEFEKYKLNLNSSTVFLSINGTIGKTAFYNGEPIILGKSACYINVLPSLVKEYLRFFLLSDAFMDYAKNNSRQATITNLGLKEIRNMPIPLPPISEQQRIVSRLDSLSAHVRELEEVLQKTIAECDALKQALLRQVFE